MWALHVVVLGPQVDRQLEATGSTRGTNGEYAIVTACGLELSHVVQHYVPNNSLCHKAQKLLIIKQATHANAHLTNASFLAQPFALLVSLFFSYLKIAQKRKS